MPLVRFINSLFAFIAVLACCAVAVTLLVLMLRFWPVLLVIVLTCGIFSRMLSRTPPTFTEN